MTVHKENNMSSSMLSDLKAAPDFELEDSEGRRVRLSDYKGSRHVVLIFNRGFV